MTLKSISQPITPLMAAEGRLHWAKDLRAWITTLEERTSLDDEQRLRIRAAHAVLENVLPRVAALMKEEPVEA